MPIDVASGDVHLDVTALDVRGTVNLAWSRRFSNSLRHRPTAVGAGWTGLHDCTLARHAGGFEYRTPAGTTELIPDREGRVEQGQVVGLPGAFLEVFMKAGCYVVQGWDVETGVVLRRWFAPGERGVAQPVLSTDDVAGRGVDLGRDPQGRLLCVVQRGGGRRMVLDYSAHGLLDRVTLIGLDGRSHLVERLEHDDAGRLRAAWNARGACQRYEYDDAGRLSREVTRHGGVFFYRYDDAGRCRQYGGLDRYDAKTLRYLEVSRLTEVRDSHDACTWYQYLPSGQVTSLWNPLGQCLRTEYDHVGRIMARLDALGSETRYGYDDAGNRSTIINALGQTHVLCHNENHQVVSVRDPKGRLWQWSYDEKNRLSGSENPMGASWKYHYDDAGRLVRLVNPSGSQQTFGYRSDGTLARHGDGAGHATALEHDVFGRLTQRIDPMGHVTRYAYDATGNLLEVHRPDGGVARAEYDAGGNMTHYTDESGRERFFEYGPCQRMVTSIDGNGHATRYEWDTEPDRLTGVINPKGERHSYRYDLAGRPVEEVFFGGRRRRYMLDANGATIRVINAMDETVSVTRDALGRIVGQTLPDGGVYRFIYDNAGDMELAVSPDCQVSFERDLVGGLVRETQTSSDAEHWIAYARDINGQVIGLRTDLGLKLTYELDQNGRWSALDMAGVGRLAFHRDACGNEIHRVFPHDLKLTQRFDAMNRLLGQQVSGRGASLMDRTYMRDDSGAITRITEPSVGLDIRYDYDPAEQLVRVLHGPNGPDGSHGAARVEHLAYDACGNLTSRLRSGDATPSTGAGDGAGQVWQYAPGDRLVHASETDYEHDAEGRLIRKVERGHASGPQVWGYEWDAFNQLRAVNRPDGQRWTYAYDAFGRRVTKTGPTGTRRFIYDARMPVHEGEGLTSEWTTWIYADDQYTPVARLGEGSFVAVFSDQVGMPAAQVAPQDLSVTRFRGDSFGRMQPGCQMPLRMMGQYADDESGLHYNMFRYYDPGIGMYICPDPAGLRGGYNVYQYGLNPVNWVDPLGLCRRGNQATQNHMDRVRDQFLAENPGFELVSGGRDPTTGRQISEHYLPPLTPGTGRSGSSFVDMRFENPTTGEVVHVQTVDAQATGPCGMSQREWDNANRISRQETATRVVTVNKGATPPPGSLNIAHMPAAGPGVVIVR